jgi:hypothetical protein
MIVLKKNEILLVRAKRTISMIIKRPFALLTVLLFYSIFPYSLNSQVISYCNPVNSVAL